MQKRTALFIGRFQPLHKGHIYAIKKAIARHGFVIIAVGSINMNDEKNPWSYGKRKSMLEAELKEYRNKYKIIGIRDTTDGEWVRKIKRIKCDAIISGNDYVWHLLKGMNLEKPAWLSPRTYNGTKIRTRIRKKKPIKHLVTKKIMKIIGQS